MEKRVRSPKGDFLIRPYENTDENGVLSLWEAAFGQVMNPAVWRWKFHDHPFERVMSVCLTASGQPVALYSGIAFPSNMSGNEISLIHGMDNMSHPKFRFPVEGKTGLFGLTVAHFVETIGTANTIRAGYGFPGFRHFRLGQLQFNYLRLSAGAVYLQCTPQDIRNQQSSVLRNCATVSCSGSNFSSLQRSLRRYYPLAAKRDEQFIHWRYFSHPVFQYTVLTTRSLLGNLKSYAVLRFDHETATLTDLMAADDEKEIFALLAGVRQALSHAGSTMVRTWLPARHFLVSHLKRAGFQELPEPLGIIPITTIYHPALTYSFIDENLFYTMGDGDLF